MAVNPIGKKNGWPPLTKLGERWGEGSANIATPIIPTFSPQGEKE
jgi:hypothetical protein